MTCELLIASCNMYLYLQYNLKRWMFQAHEMFPQRFSKVFSQPQPPAQTTFEVWELIWAFFKLRDTTFCHCSGSGLFPGCSKWQMLSIFPILYYSLYSNSIYNSFTVFKMLVYFSMPQFSTNIHVHFNLWDKEISLLISIFKYLKLAVLLEESYC